MLRLARLALCAAVACGAAAATAPALRAAPQADSRPKSLNLHPHLPTTPQRVSFVVETNKLGQVTRVRSGKHSTNETFDTLTYGNALQAYIRTAGGGAVAGTYRLDYSYDPKTQKVHRDVQLVRAGGVDPNAEGAVNQMAGVARAEEAKRASASPLPDLKHITGHRH